jgi:hypothetical protein
MKKPEISEIVNYLVQEKNYDEFTAMGFADQFWNFYESKGWKVGKNPMVSWKASIRTWEINKKKDGTHKQSSNGSKQAGANQLLASIQRDFAARGKTNLGE